jgi:hypothetical protein
MSTIPRTLPTTDCVVEIGIPFIDTINNHIAIEIRMIKIIGNVNVSVEKLLPTVFDTFSPRKNTPIRFITPPNKTAILKLNKPAPTAGVIVSSLAPIVKATIKPTPRATVIRRGSVSLFHLNE